MVLVLASELMQYVSANALYGGDVRSAVNAMTIMVEKMGYQVEKVPTMEQREAMVMELAQATVKTASSLLSPENLPAWQDLPNSQRTSRACLAERFSAKNGDPPEAGKFWENRFFTGKMDH